jgi:glycosyltransferase involved in cell wall biosynthesis
MKLVYPAFDVVALSSLSEGFPNVLIEAMACGVPCVSSDVGDASSIIKTAGLVVPPSDSLALSSALAKVLTLESEAYKHLSQRARSRVCDTYSVETIVREYEDLFRLYSSGSYKRLYFANSEL